jgi:hypothetical protein
MRYQRAPFTPPPPPPGLPAFDPPLSAGDDITLLRCLCPLFRITACARVTCAPPLSRLVINNLITCQSLQPTSSGTLVQRSVLNLMQS